MLTTLRDVSRQYSVDPALTIGLVNIESSGNPWAWNPEPRYPFLWDVTQRRPFRVLTPGVVISPSPPEDFLALAGDADQEWWGQRASWGLMQIMGSVAREEGFRGPYLT